MNESKASRHNIPLEFRENLIYRSSLLSKAHDDVDLQAQIKALCKRDFFFFVDTFVFTFDPRMTFFDKPIVPFILFDKQREFCQSVIDAINGSEDITLEKSRDEGATWMILTVFYWFWLFKEGSNFLIGSMNIDAVHIKGNMSTLFPKLEYISRHLPKWLLPKGYSPAIHENYCRLNNPESGNSIVGQSGEAFATSGRYTAILFDELAKIDPRIAEIGYESAHQATKCRIGISTPFGQYGLYYRLISNTTDTATRKARIHWSDDPRKNSDLIYIEVKNSDYAINPAKNENLFAEFKGNTSKTPLKGYIPTSSWYRSECKRFMGDPEKGDNGIKQELDIEYLGTGLTYFNQDIVEQRLKECKPPLFKGELERIENGDLSNEKWYKNYGKSNVSVEFIENPNGNLWIWEMPLDSEEVYDYQYSASCDPAKGLNGVNDSTSITIKNRVTSTVVARWHGKTQFVEEVCINIDSFYHSCMMWNVDATGNSTVAINLEAKGLDLVAQLVEESHTKRTVDRIGFNFNRSSKPLLYQMFRQALQDNSFTDFDERLWLQLKTVINDKGVIKGAGKGELQSHDDIADDMALNIYCDANMPSYFEQKAERAIKELSKDYNIIQSSKTSGNDGRKSYIL